MAWATNVQALLDDLLNSLPGEAASALMCGGMRSPGLPRPITPSTPRGTGSGAHLGAVPSKLEVRGNVWDRLKAQNGERFERLDGRTAPMEVATVQSPGLFPF